MINDGGAERMVRNRRVEWWQIVAIAVMFVFVGVTFLFFFFIGNGEQMVEALNKATVKDAYDILTDVKAQYPDLAVTSYEQNDTEVIIEFKYYETVLEKEDVDFQKLNYEIKVYLEKYLSEHPEDFINNDKKKVTLKFPNVIYSNVNPNGDFEYEGVFCYVTYKYADITAGDFLEKLASIKNAKTLIFDSSNGILNFGTNPDFSKFENIDGLYYLEIGNNNLEDEQKKLLEEICKDKNIELKINN